jgi:hypothetical protein
MATHNLILRLGDDVFLEVIALDPDAEAPAGPRWFGLDKMEAVRRDWREGRRLRAWVARTNGFDAALLRHGDLLGRKTRVSRAERSWFFSVRPDRSLAEDGVVPPIIDWGGRGSPAPGMPDVGARLLEFAIEHPDPIRVGEVYRRLEVVNPPQARQGSELRYRASINTPGGERQLW